MNKINRFLLAYIIVITVLCGYMCYVTLGEKQTETAKQLSKVQSTVTTEKIKKTKETTVTIPQYKLAVRSDMLVVIDANTNRVFEYTDLDANQLPQEVKQMLSTGTIFDNVTDVYYFLESYSS